MPWSAEGMHAHNHSLTGLRSLHAAHVANAILRRTGNEGMALATAGKLAHRDTGGMTPGLAPSNATEQPVAQSYIQRFAALPVEQLEELIPRLGNSPLASIAARVLQSKRVAPQPTQQQASPAVPQMGIPAQTPAQARGGMIPRRAAGGSSAASHPFGAIDSDGRATQPTPTEVTQPVLESTITPQEKTANYLAANGTVNGTGQSTATNLGTGINPNTGVGTSHTANPGLDAYLNATQAGASYAPPKGYVAPKPASTASSTPAAIVDDTVIPGTSTYDDAQWGGSGGFERGGMTPRSDTVPILAAGGEFTVNPAFVAKLGNGDIALGHKRLDAWVVMKRQEIIRDMQRLKPPVKS